MKEKETKNTNRIGEYISLAVLVTLLIVAMCYANKHLDQQSEIKTLRQEKDSVINENCSLKIELTRKNDIILGICKTPPIETTKKYKESKNK